MVDEIGEERAAQYVVSVGGWRNDGRPWPDYCLGSRRFGSAKDVGIYEGVSGVENRKKLALFCAYASSVPAASLTGHILGRCGWLHRICRRSRQAYLVLASEGCPHACCCACPDASS